VTVYNLKASNFMLIVYEHKYPVGPYELLTSYDAHDTTHTNSKLDLHSEGVTSVGNGLRRRL
jgi:hypothetical protein